MLVEMFLIPVAITEVFCCFWKSQQLITCLLFILPQFVLGLVNDFVEMSYCNGNILCIWMPFLFCALIRNLIWDEQIEGDNISFIEGKTTL